MQSYLVGDKRPSDEITQEYSKADHTYVEKTIVRPLHSSIVFEEWRTDQWC